MGERNRDSEVWNGDLGAIYILVYQDVVASIMYAAK